MEFLLQKLSCNGRLGVPLPLVWKKRRATNG